jgi:hypothetical protein
LLTTVARQTTRNTFSMWSDPSLLRNNGKAAFSTRSRGNNSQCNSGCFLCGLFTGYIAGQLRGQSVNNGKGRHKTELAAKQRVQQLQVHELRGQFQLRVSIRAEQQSSEKSCRRTDPAVLEDRQPVKSE